MKLIIMHSRSGAEAKISLQSRWLIVSLSILFVIAMVAGAALQRMAWPVNAPVETHGSHLQDPDLSLTHETVHALAARLGEIQAGMTRLDGLGRRFAEVAGLPQDRIAFVRDVEQTNTVIDEMFVPMDAQAGRPPVSELERKINAIQAGLARQDDQFSTLDLRLTALVASVGHLPTTMPISTHSHLSSTYGWRRHPFNGQMSMHEGLDFSAPVGTPIRASAGGVVKTVSSHTGYGKMVEVDHGNGLLTRYAHAQTILVSEGALVTRGQVIAKVGSTGLSTGPHLHFEVRKHDKALDPRVFLAGQPQMEAIARAPTPTNLPGVSWRPRLR